MDTLSVIRQFVCERTGVAAEAVVPAAAWEELGVDSVLLLELLFEYEEKESKSLPKDLALPKTVGDLIDCLDQLTPSPQR